MLGVGVGITDQLMINGSLRGLVYGEYALLCVALGPVGFLFSDEHFAACIGLSYYVRKKSPSWFVEAGIGGGTLGNPFDDEVIQQDDIGGPSCYGGIGYEFRKHFQVELNWSWTENKKDDYNRHGKWTANSVFLSLGVMGY